MLLSIITPTYNRIHCLPDLYESLLRNNHNNDFEWIIVDDGSIDQTEKIVKNWISDKKINIQYIRKRNEGKSNALIDGFNLPLKGKFSVVVDSDDILIDNAVHYIKNQSQSLSLEEIGCVFLKSDLDGNLIGSKFYKKKANYVELYFGKNKTSGDKLFIVKTEVYKNSLVKAFEGEKLIPESVFYLNMKKYGNFKCCNQVIYCGNYLNDGLSFDVIKLVAANIKGFIFEKHLIQKQKLSFLETIKNEIKYISYSYSGGKSLLEIISLSFNPFLTSILVLPTYIITFRRIKVIKEMRLKLVQ